MDVRKEALEEDVKPEYTDFFYTTVPCKHQQRVPLQPAVSLRQPGTFMRASYRPTNPPTLTQAEQAAFARKLQDIRKDVSNLRYDLEEESYYFLPRDHPEYREENKGCFDPFCSLF